MIIAGGTMGKLIIGTHIRLEEVAGERGYFATEGLEYELVPGSRASRLSIPSAEDLPKELIRRAVSGQSGCHYSAIRALENVLPRERVRLHYEDSTLAAACQA